MPLPSSLPGLLLALRKLILLLLLVASLPGTISPEHPQKKEPVLRDPSIGKKIQN